MRIRPVNMEFLYGTAFLSHSPEAYERLILDAMRGEATLFTRNDEVEAQWRICDPILSGWADGTSPRAIRRARRARRGRLAVAPRPQLAHDLRDHELAALDDTVWAAEHTTPAEIESALRGLLAERHAEDDARACARAEPDLHRRSPMERRDREPLAYRRAQSRIAHDHLCGQPGRTTLDAVASVAADAAATDDGAALTFETVMVDVGSEHLEHLDSIVDPLVVTDIPTLVWAPHGHWAAVDALAGLSQSVLVDSMDDPDVGGALRRAAHLLEHRNVVDLAWLRSTPWRERVAMMFDAPRQRARLRMIDSVTVRHHPISGAAALLLCGWLGSRLGWPVRQLRRDGRGHAEGKLGEVTVKLDSVAQEVPGLAGLTLGMRDGGLISLDRGPGGLRATRREADGTEREWRLLGASRGEGGILGEGIRLSLVGDAIYGEALVYTSGMLEQ